jgi:lipoprotein signal peptidase
VIHAGIRDIASLLVARRAPVVALAATAAGVVVVDGMSKTLALHLLPALDVASTRLLRLGVLHNGDLAWGLSAGAESAAISAVVALVIACLSLTVREALIAYDRVAPVMLGLLVGAGIANAADALTPPAGVVDWIAIGAGSGLVFNLADVAVMVGMGLWARTVWRLALAIGRARVMSSRTSDASVGIYSPRYVASHGAVHVDPDTRSLPARFAGSRLLRDDRPGESSLGSLVRDDPTPAPGPALLDREVLRVHPLEPCDLAPLAAQLGDRAGRVAAAAEEPLVVADGEERPVLPLDRQPLDGADQRRTHAAPLVRRVDDDRADLGQAR